MSRKRSKISLIYFVTLTLLLVGLVPLLLTGYFLSERSGRELHAVENRYQIQLVQEKARQIEMFLQRYGDISKSVGSSIEFSNGLELLSSPKTEEKLGGLLRDDSNLAALYVKPATGEALSLFRPGMIERPEADQLAGTAISGSSRTASTVGEPTKIPSSGAQVLTIVSPVVIDGTEVASVVAIVSLDEISKSVVGTEPKSDNELWAAGLPIVFVVDSSGQTLFHPDRTFADNHRSLVDLKIVEEWRQSNQQIQSGCVPFTSVHDGTSYDMIGAYSTAAIWKRSASRASSPCRTSEKLSHRSVK